MFEPVYVCRDSVYDMILVIPARIGIVKIKGCVQFYRAKKLYGGYTNWEADVWISQAECRKRYSSVPDNGTAHLVEEGRKFINWTRVDHNLHLLNVNGSIVKQLS